MPLKIVKPDEPIFVETLVMCIFGEPGIGKSSAAFTAQRPLLLDFDNGCQRANARTDTVIIDDWRDIAELTSSDLSSYDTIVVDTVGRCLEILAVHLFRQNPKYRRAGSSDLSMQGYGALKGAFSRWIGQLRRLHKDIILLANAREERDGDYMLWRIDAMGSSKDEVLKVSDLLGFMGCGRKGAVLDFNPTDNHFGKNCAGFPALVVPDFAKEPQWLAGLMRQARERLNEEVRQTGK